MSHCFYLSFSIFMNAKPNLLPFARSLLKAYNFNTNIYSPRKVHTDICFKKAIMLGIAIHAQDFMMLNLWYSQR